MQTKANIAILMATYNGEKYLREQIDSLFAQTCQNWHLYVHDDGSNDGTVAILNDYAEKYPSEITLMEYPSQGGACKNFLSMLERVEAPYYMFCDQDDVWMPEKIESSFSKMKETEAKEEGKPVIVDTDLVVVNEHLQVIHTSFRKYERIEIDFPKKFVDFAALNVVTGCTMLFNHEVKKNMRRPYDKAVMHDAWITLCTIAENGVLCNMESPTVLYRQHGDNTLGARDVKMLTWKYRVHNIRKVILLNVSHYRQMKAIAPITLWEYISAKLRYRKVLYLRKEFDKQTAAVL